MRDFLSARCQIQLSCCVVLQHPPDIEVLRIFAGRLQTAGAGRSRYGPDRTGLDLLEVNTEAAGVAETFVVESWGNTPR